MAEKSGLGVYHCDKCEKSYTKGEIESYYCYSCKKSYASGDVKSFKKSGSGYKCPCGGTTKEFKKTDKGYKCPCGGLAKEIMPVKAYHLSHSDFQSGVERFYYWILEYLLNKDYELTKIKDVYTASEASDFWGDLERRKQFQEEQAMKYLANIGAMIKSLFQMIRELRMIDERLNHYEGREKGHDEDDIALKGIWIDKVEGGAQKPTSIYGMATQRGFVTLPDYFFRIFPKTKEDIPKYMEALKKDQGANDKLIEILKRKLAEYITWVDNTKKELEVGKKFKLMYLRQHFHIIRMYLEWVKPYIKQVSMFNMNNAIGGPKSANWVEIIRAAEGAVIELELFGTSNKAEKVGRSKDFTYRPCIRVAFHYSIVPEMLYRKEYQKGAIHVGVSIIDFQSYILTEEDIKKYKEEQIEDDIEAVRAVDSSIEALRDDIITYLKQANDTYYIDEKGKTKEIKEPKKEEFWGSLGKAFGKIFSKKSLPSKFDRERAKNKLKKKATDDVWDVYDDMKKSFEMVRW